MAIMNSVTMAKFFYIIYDTLFVFLLTNIKLQKKLLKAISNYFAMIKINSYNIFYLHYFV